MIRRCTFLATVYFLAMALGCELPSTRIALDGYRRGRTVQSWVVQQQHDEIVRLVFREQRRAAMAAETDEARSEAFRVLAQRVQVAYDWLDQYRQAEFILDATVLSKLVGSRHAAKAIWDDLKARAKSHPSESGGRPPEPPPPPEADGPAARLESRQPLKAKLTSAVVAPGGVHEGEGSSDVPAGPTPSGLWNGDRFVAYGDLPARLR